MAKRLYTLILPKRSEVRTGTSGQRNVATFGNLSEGSPNVQPVSTQPGERSIGGQLVGKYAKRMAAEFETLFGSDAIQEVVYLSTDDPTESGYYTASDVDQRATDPREQRVQSFSGTLTKVGTKKSHWRAVGLFPQDLDNPFEESGTEGARVNTYLPARARNPRWYVPETGAVTTATPQTTVDGRLGRVARFDVQDAPGNVFGRTNGLSMVYDISYTLDGVVDPILYDTHDQPKEEVRKADADNRNAETEGAKAGRTRVVTRTWQKVYDTAHEFDGLPLAENGVIRVDFDESQESLRFYEWSETPDDEPHRYEPVQLPATSWDLYDADFTRVGDDRITVRCIWEDASAGLYELDASIRRGAGGILWSIPANEGAIPTGLSDHLAPTADVSAGTAAGDKTVIARKEVRK
jgi:hypothetical protein